MSEFLIGLIFFNIYFFFFESAGTKWISNEFHMLIPIPLKTLIC